jgi:Skp family chaperone for outer membrane proteins
MSLKKVTAVGGLVLAFGLLSGAPANATELVCVNNQEILEISTYAKHIQQLVQQKEQELKKQLEQKVQPLQQKLMAIQQQIQSGLLSQEAVKQKQQEALKIQQQIQQLVIETQQEYQKFAQEQFDKLTQLEKAALKALSKTLGFKSVIDCRAFIYYTPEVDITEQTAKVMDQLAKEAKGNY